MVGCGGKSGLGGNRVCVGVLDATASRRKPPDDLLFPAGEGVQSDPEAFSNQRLTESTRLLSRSRDVRIESMVARRWKKLGAKRECVENAREFGDGKI